MSIGQIIDVLLAWASAVPLWLAIVGLCVAVGAMVMTIINLSLLKLSDGRARPVGGSGDGPGSIGVCIPARNEEGNLADCVGAVLKSDDPALMVYVYDDQSTDETPGIVARLVSGDPRVVSVPTLPLPVGWVGKQWACQRLGEAARTEFVLFIDADVRLAPDCLRRSRGELLRARAELISMFPRQVTGTLAERLCVPMIHFILLSYLPIARMRSMRDPSASAGCGQFLFARRSAYVAAGGHAAFKDSMHDGIKMPRAFRRSGFHTDLFDGTDLASCRMYTGLGATWRGFAKNAYEGLGNPALLIFLTMLHGVGHVLAWLVLLISAMGGFGNLSNAMLGVCIATCTIHLVQRVMLAVRFKQPWVGVVLHPVGVVLMTAIQWHSFALALAGRRGWRGRVLAAHAGHLKSDDLSDQSGSGYPKGAS